MKPRFNAFLYGFSFIFIASLYACDDFSKRDMNTKAIAEEVRNRKIKHISEGQILEWVSNKGTEIISILNEDESKADTLASKYKIKIKKIFFDTEESLNPFEKEVLDAYQYAAENNLSADNNVQVMKESNELLFNAPLVQNKKIKGMWNIVFSRKEAVILMDIKK